MNKWILRASSPLPQPSEQRWTAARAVRKLLKATKRSHLNFCSKSY